MATSRLAEVIDALVDLFTATVDTNQIAVSDGPHVQNDRYRAEVLIGHDGSTDTDGDAGSSEQEDVGLGTRNRRDEEVTVNCAVLCWQAENDPELPRKRAYAILDDLEQAILADRQLGFPAAGAEGGARNARIDSTTLYYSNNAGGASARVSFTVKVTCRL